MALIKSTMFSTMRGSIGGTTFSTNRYGMYARNRTVLANPNTGNQILARGGLASASQLWRTLAASQQLGWINYASLTPVPNRIGDMIHLSGINMFVKANAFFNFLGAPTVLDAPTSPGLATPISSVSVTITDGQTEMAFTDWVGGSTSNSSHYGLWVSAPVSAGTSFFKGPWSYVGTYTGDTRDTGADLFTPFTAGQIVFLRIRYGLGDGKMAKDYISGPITVVPAP